ncbi:uncharacterized protein METZ01_LOCUS97488, partial [marine metagenome]
VRKPVDYDGPLIDSVYISWSIAGGGIPVISSEL